MEVIIENYEPFIYVFLEGKEWKNLNIKCLIDTWFSGSLATPYFKGKWKDKSLVNDIDFLEIPILFDKKIETASWYSKTYKTFVWIQINWEKVESELLIFESEIPFSKEKDYLILWMKFLKENKKNLNINFDNNIFNLI